jgi:succinate dehydrogenase / fumarate reductase membrane anchor subunit
MVTSVTSFSRNGLSDWLIQRVTSLVLLAYFAFVAIQVLGGDGIDYSAWRALHETTAMRVFTLLAVLSLAAHAWIGLWAVFTDYLTERMLGPIGNPIRLLCQLGTVLALVILVLWVIEILWR